MHGLKPRTWGLGSMLRISLRFLLLSIQGLGVEGLGYRMEGLG